MINLLLDFSIANLKRYLAEVTLNCLVNNCEQEAIRSKVKKVKYKSTTSSNQMILTVSFLFMKKLLHSHNFNFLMIIS